MPLTVGQLKRYIQNFDDACTVAFCIDAEANGHKHVHSAYEGVVTHGHGWKPTIVATDSTADEILLEDLDPRPGVVIPKGEDWLDDDKARETVWAAVLKHTQGIGLVPSQLTLDLFFLARY